MKTLFLLIGAFVSSVAFSKILTGEWHVIFSGNLAMFLMLCLTASGHFLFTKGMILMMPELVPFKKELVYFTGIAEALLGLGLLFPAFRFFSGIILITLFVLMLPANIHAAIKHINFETATFDGKGIEYLWIRIPMQAFFIAWTWYFSITSMQAPYIKE